MTSPRSLPVTPLRKMGIGSEFQIESITTTSRKLPDRMLLHASAKWGKTSFGAQAPQPVFLLSRSEDGLWTLMENGQLPSTIAHFPRPAENFLEVKLALNELIVKEHPYQTLVIDTLNGVERLIHEQICQSQCDGSWEKFDAYGRGPKLAISTWIDLLSLLDRVRERGLAILCLSHNRVTTFKNPGGLDYDRWEPDFARDTWSLLKKWFDLILFGTSEVVTRKTDPRLTKGKAEGGQTRLLLTEPHAAYEAGNRHGLPEEIECGSSPAEAWSHFQKALQHVQES